MQEEPGPANPTGRAILPRTGPARSPPRRARASSTHRCRTRRCSRPSCAHRRPLRDAARRGEPRGLPAAARRRAGAGATARWLAEARARALSSTGRTRRPTTSSSPRRSGSTSDLYKRRPDVVGFVNGIPLLLIELKDLTQPVQEAYDDNLRDYRDTIPQLFDFNGFVILSNGLEALMGASHAPFESLRAVEASGGGRAGERRAGDDAAGDLRAGALPRPGRELPAVRGRARRAAQGRRQEPSGARRQPRHRGRAADRARTRAGSASSGTRRAAARASRWSSSPRRCCGGSAATGPS